MEQEIAQKPIEPATTQIGQPQAKQPEQQIPGQPKKKGKWWVWLIVVIVVLALAGGAYWWFFMR